MRFLLLSDTHGKLGIINELAAVVRAERWSSNPTVTFVRRWAKACSRRLELHFKS